MKYLYRIKQDYFFLLFITLKLFSLNALENNGPISFDENSGLSQDYLAHLRSCITCACASGCTLTGSQFCSLQVTNSACIAQNLQVGGNLTVCGTINYTGFLGNNYLFAYRAITQTIGVSAPTFQDIIFTDAPTINGWVIALPSADFFCAQTGNYLIEYDAICRITNSQLSNISIIAVLNGVEIPGSQATIQQPTNNKPLALSHSFIATITENDVLKLQFTGQTDYVQLEANSGNSSIITPVNGVQPSITLTITRVS
jgi:hypothetical protein